MQQLGSAAERAKIKSKPFPQLGGILSSLIFFTSLCYSGVLGKFFLLLFEVVLAPAVWVMVACSAVGTCMQQSTMVSYMYK